MQLGTRARYSLRMMLCMGKLTAQGQTITLTDIAKTSGISRRYLDQLVVGLKNASLIRARLGRGGGYVLARPAEEIKLSDIVQAAIGPIAIVECLPHADLCVQSEFCACRPLWMLINRRIVNILNEYSLADLLDNDWPKRIRSELEALDNL